MPSLYKRGRIWWYAFKDHSGKRIARSTGSRDKRIAHQIAMREEYKVSLVRLGLVDQSELRISERANTPIRELIDEFCKTLPDGQSANLARSVLGKFVASARVTVVQQFDDRDVKYAIRDYLDEYADTGVQLRSVQDHFRKIRKFSKFLQDEEYIRRDYAAQLRPDRIRGTNDPKVPHRALTPCEAESMFAVEERGLWYRFRVWTGMRDSEARRVHRQDVCFEDTPHVRIRAEISKNNLACCVPLAPSLAASLQASVGMRMGGSLFSERCAGEKWAGDIVQDATSFGLKAINVRSLRMTHTTWLRMAGIDSDIIGTLRRDKGTGTTLLQRWHYTDEAQLLPKLLDALVKTERWYEGELMKERATNALQC